MLPLKWENLSLCSTKSMYFCKKLPLALGCRQNKYSLLMYNIHILPISKISSFCSSFYVLFPKAPASCGKKNRNKSFYIVLLFVCAQKVCLRFLKSYFKLETLILLFFVVSFQQIYSTKKHLLLTKKSSAAKSKIHFIEN